MAQKKETEAAIKVNESIQEHDSCIKQLEQLKEYRNDYVAQFKKKGENGISASRLSEYQTFVQKIDGAIEEQMQALNAKQLKVAEQQKKLQKSNSKKKVVEKLIEKSVKQESVMEQKQSQNEADDRVSTSGVGNDVLMWRLT